MHGSPPFPADVDPKLFQLLAEQVRDYAVFLLDPDGNILSWNLGARLIKGYPAEEIIGRHFSVFYPPEATRRGWPAFELQEAKREGRFEDEGWRIRKDGSRFWANVVITALRDEEGRLIAFSKITRDLTDKRRMEEERRQGEERFRVLVEGVQDYAIYMLSPDGMITSWNSGAERIKGYKRDEVIGRHYSRFFPQDAIALDKPWEELALARRDGRVEVEGWRVKKNGDKFWARVVVTALYDAQGQLRGFAKVTQDLTQRRQLQALEHSAKKINEFIALLAHEIRNPLAPMHSALLVMREADPADPRQQHMREILERQVRRLTRITDDMIDISRITRGTLAVERKPVALRKVLEASAEVCEPGLRQQGHRFALDAADGIVVEGDFERLVQVFGNLLNNAVKYTPPGGSIRVQARVEAGEAVVSVTDDGRGLHGNELESIFQMFVQGRSPLDRVDSGMGVGLALARNILDLHQGRIQAFSDGPGKGAQFVVHLPLSAAAAPGVAPAQVRPAPSRPEGPRRVLIVDDNVDAANALQGFLKAIGHETHVVYDGPKALEAYDAFQPDIVLLDIGLPGMNGYEVARHLRARGRKVRIVAITGWSQPQDIRQADEAGFDQHLIKPVDEVTLMSALRPAEKGALH